MSSSERIIRRPRPGSATDGSAREPVSGLDSARPAGVTRSEGTVIRGRRTGLPPARGATGGPLPADFGPAAVPGRDGSGSPGSNGQRGATGTGIPAGRASAGAARPVRGGLGSPSLQVELRDLHRRAEERGYAVGRARAEAELAAAIEAAGAMAARIEALAPRESSAVAHALATLSTAIARRIVGAELHLDPAILVRALESAVTAINGSPEARVLLHPDQLEPVRSAWETAHGTAYLGKRWTFEADASLPPGGCVLRYEHGVVAAGLEAQIEEIATAIDDALPGLGRGRPVEPRTDGS